MIRVMSQNLGSRTILPVKYSWAEGSLDFPTMWPGERSKPSCCSYINLIAWIAISGFHGWEPTAPSLVWFLQGLEYSPCIWWGWIALSWDTDGFHEALQRTNFYSGRPDSRESILDKLTSASHFFRIFSKTVSWSLMIYFFQKCGVIPLGLLPGVVCLKEKKQKTKLIPF